MAARVVLPALAAALHTLAAAPADAALNPYQLLHGGARTGSKVAASPDPLVDYKWDLSSIDRFVYQTFVDQPVSATAEPAAAFSGVGGMTSAASEVPVRGAGLITAKFAQEGACWVEFESKGFAASGAKIDMTISENRLPGEVHNLVPKAHNGTYRLEPNNQLYEGVRYIFMNVTDPGSSPWSIENFRRVCQTVPTNYEGHFTSSDETLDRIWWTGAYTARVTMVGVGLHSPQAFLGSELKDRGDRIAFLGDAHATQPTVLAAFQNYEMLWSSNEHTKGTLGNFGGIQPYWLMWCESILDLYDATGNTTAFMSYQPYMEQRFDHAQTILSSWVDPENTAGFASPSLDWSRDDDRMGFGFESPNLPEARNAFKALLVGSSRRYAAAIGKLGNHTASATYASLADAVEKEIKAAGPDWYLPHHQYQMIPTI
jgi:alpha-L-rhamnosidase